MGQSRELKALELDALREVANIGAGHAATALSQLTRRRVMINVPEIRLGPFQDIPGLVDAGEVTVAVVMKVFGDLTGRVLLAFGRGTVMRLVDCFMGLEPGRTQTLAEMEQSAIKEAGNILGGAYLNALSEFLGMILLPSVPALTLDLASAVTAPGEFDVPDGNRLVFCIENLFQVNASQGNLRGQFLFLPDEPAVQAILQAIRVG
ncbi:MAG: chemotaxis protein CheC [Gemmatimonadetes bacterium]|nr:chemotaxis protein CheC [Gemmatimonadota bacterium]